MTKLGLVQVYTGSGKGKTTASLGLTLRAVGHGFRVCMIQFMKDNARYGESLAAQYLPGFRLIKAGRDAFVDIKNPDPVDSKLARQGWELAKSVITSREYEIVILDELNVLMAAKMVSVEEVVKFLQDNRNQGVEVVLTGRYAPEAILELADLVTEMQEIKHPFQEGIPSRQGVDY